MRGSSRRKARPRQAARRFAAAAFLASALVATGLPASFGPAGAAAQGGSFLDMLFGGPSPRRRGLEEDAPQRLLPRAPARPRAPRAPGPKRKSRPSDAAAAPKAAAIVPAKSQTARVVLVVGDFMAGSLAKGLTSAVAGNPEIKVVASANGASGLVRDDHYDWPESIGPLIDAQKPAAVVVMLGSNERQPIDAPDGALPLRSEEWTAEYGRRAGELAEAVTSRKVPLIWVGMPAFRSDRMNDDMAFLNDLYRQTAAEAGGEFVDVWEGFVDANGAFASTGPGLDGQPARLRNDDGITMTAAGAEKLAFFAEKPIFRLLGTGPGGGAPAVASPDGRPRPGAPAASAANATSAPAVALNDPALDGGDELLTGLPGKRSSGDPSPREKLVLSGLPSEARAGRADDFTWNAKGAAVAPGRGEDEGDGAAIVSRGSLDLGRLRAGEGVKPPPPMPSLADAIIEDWAAGAKPGSPSAAAPAAPVSGNALAPASEAASGAPPAAASKPAEDRPAETH